MAIGWDISILRSYHNAGNDGIGNDYFFRCGGGTHDAYRIEDMGISGSYPFYRNGIVSIVSHYLGIGIGQAPYAIDNGFALPPIEEFEKVITPKTKAISANGSWRNSTTRAKR